MVLDLCFADGKNYLHVHPMFLHSNATSHKWAFGGMLKQFSFFCMCYSSVLTRLICFSLSAAVAELLDNAVDEVRPFF